MAYVHTKLLENWPTGSKLKLNGARPHTHTQCGETISLLPLLYARKRNSQLLCWEDVTCQ